MALYECDVCGYIYDEEKESKLWKDLPENYKCPVCTSGKIYFSKKEVKKSEKTQETTQKNIEEDSKAPAVSIDYSDDFKRDSDKIEKHMADIHKMAVSGKSIIEPMRTKLNIFSWDDILIKGAQLFRTPLDVNQEVTTKTIIGKKARKPLEIETPFYITHMSFGALSKEVKISLAKGSSVAKTAMCSGEGGILEESINNSYKYIFEYVPNKYSVTDENLKRVDAIEIKMGQSTKPGLGGHLPGVKVTEEIAKVRGKKERKDIISPPNFNEIKNKEDLKELVNDLRKRSDGRPIGIKIAAGHLEKDLEIIVYAEPDFITIDGRGGGTGASPKFVKDSTSIPTIFALYRARRYLDSMNSDINLVITGGLRISSDFIKAIAMGADAVAIGTSAMIAAACQQYRICNEGSCPVGVATQDTELRKRLHIENSAKRVENFLKVSLEEIIEFSRLTGNKSVHDFSIDDLLTTNSEISEYTNIKHV